MARVDHGAETICKGEGHFDCLRRESRKGCRQGGGGGGERGVSDGRVDNLCWAHSFVNPCLSQKED